jgi:hypothetical protein
MTVRPIWKVTLRTHLKRCLNDRKLGVLVLWLIACPCSHWAVSDTVPPKRFASGAWDLNWQDKPNIASVEKLVSVVASQLKLEAILFLIVSTLVTSCLTWPVLSEVGGGLGLSSDAEAKSPAPCQVRGDEFGIESWRIWALNNGAILA